MALITQYDDANKEDIEPTITTRLTIGTEKFNGVLMDFFNDVTTGRYRYVGMTYTAAMSCYTAINNPSNGVTAIVRHVAGQMYEVEVNVYLSQTVAVAIGG